MRRALLPRSTASTSAAICVSAGAYSDVSAFEFGADGPVPNEGETCAANGSKVTGNLDTATVYSRTADGQNIPPLRTISGAATGLNFLGTIGNTSATLGHE